MRKAYAGTMIQHNGKTLALSEWARELQIPYPVLRMRYRRGVTDPAKLLRPPEFHFTGGKARVVSVLERAPQSVSMLERLLPPDVLESVMRVAEQAGFTPEETVVRLVRKKAAELLALENEKK